MGFHEVPWDSMKFHEIPWGSMRFYDVPVNRSVPTKANRGLTSYSFCTAAVEAWDAVPQDWIDNTIYSMPQRLEAVQKACGWHTKY
jgi:hypothetical protein